jgi:hypothetical protein
VNILLPTAGPAAEWPVVDALRAVADVRGIDAVAVPDPADRAELDPLVAAR